MSMRYSTDFEGGTRLVHELGLCHFDTVTGDDGKSEFPRTVMDAIWDELVAAIQILVAREAQ